MPVLFYYGAKKGDEISDTKLNSGLN